jgi:hypothetical protein
MPTCVQSHRNPFGLSLSKPFDRLKMHGPFDTLRANGRFLSMECEPGSSREAALRMQAKPLRDARKAVAANDASRWTHGRQVLRQR